MSTFEKDICPLNLAAKNETKIIKRQGLIKTVLSAAILYTPFTSVDSIVLRLPFFWQYLVSNV
jgi:hypothetical protein